MTRKALLDEFRRRTKGKLLKEIAHEIGVSIALVSAVLNGDRRPAGKVLRWLGYRRVVTESYERV